MDDTKNTSRAESPDEQFAERVRAAYGTIAPSEGVRERMLEGAKAQSRNWKRRRRLRNGGIAAAACLAVAVLGFGGLRLYLDSAPISPLIGNLSSTENPESSESANDVSGEGYTPLSEPGFVETDKTPKSTVSADVDTASYANVRRMIESGVSADHIPEGAVRTEEMLNYFKYDYPDPDDGKIFSTNVQVGACPWNENTELLVLGFATKKAKRAQTGANLVFLVDTSGSMKDENKLPLLKKSLSKLIGELGSRDRVSIVAYSNEVKTVLSGARGDEREKILTALEGLVPDGGTYAEGGLKRAYELARENYIEGGSNRVIMASDGAFNMGVSGERQLKKYISKKRKEGTYLSILGLGSGNLQDSKLETLADNGNGIYRYIDSEEEAERVFEDNLAENIDPLADDVKVQVEFNPSWVKAYRLIGYENRSMTEEQFEDDGADAGDVGPGAQFTVAYEVVRADSAYEPDTVSSKGSKAERYGDDGPGSDAEWAGVTIRYKKTGSKKESEQFTTVSQADWTREPTNDWKFAASVIEYAMTLRGSEFKGGASCDSVLALLAGMELDADREGFKELVQETRSLG